MLTKSLLSESIITRWENELFLSGFLEDTLQNRQLKVLVLHSRTLLFLGWISLTIGVLFVFGQKFYAGVVSGTILISALSVFQLANRGNIFEGSLLHRGKSKTILDAACLNIARRLI